MLDLSGEGLTQESETSLHSFHIPEYFALDWVRKDLKSCLNLAIRQNLFAVLVHGSHATGEVIPFSDFDGLIILKSPKRPESRKTFRRISKAIARTERLFYRHDPLQHHGWFILTERGLEDWPQDYLPVEVLEHASCLLPGEGIDLSIKVRKHGHDYLTPFHRLCSSIQQRLDRIDYPDNLYRLKSLLSEFMLLPALYVQARDGKGIFKKFSFDAARKDFPKEEWRIMDEVSRIREEWNYPVTGWRRFMLTRTHPLLRRLGIRWAPRIPEPLNGKLTPDFYACMANLVRCMEEKLVHDPH